jgi:pyruvate formate lyase activating enzyme
MSQEFNAESIEGPFGFTSPERIVEIALQKKTKSIAYTYNDPTVFAEYALEAMKIAKKKGLHNVWVSNGYFSKELRKEILPFLHAINIDLKGGKEFYEKTCGGINREKVLENIEWIYRHKVHLELTYLIVPGFNDKEKDFKQAVEFVLSLNPKIPLHFSAFHPAFKLSYLPSTSSEKVLQAKQTAEKAGLKFAYAGNIGESENSYCPECKNLLVKRQNYSTQLVGIKGKKCSNCGYNLGKDFVF